MLKFNVWINGPLLVSKYSKRQEVSVGIKMRLSKKRECDLRL